LKPYIYYTCRYKKGDDTDFVVNYTLDNAVVVYGYIEGTYVTRSGYLYNGYVAGISEPEDLTETLLIFIDKEKTKWFTKEYAYVNLNGTKVYKNIGKTINTSNFSLEGFTETFENDFFLYKDNQKVGVGTLDISAITDVKDRSAEEYNKSADKDSASSFANWWNTSGPGKLEGTIKPVETKEGEPDNTKDLTDVWFPANGLKVESDEDIKNIEEHKRAVIQRSIKSNLYTAMANFSKNSLSSYEFRMPEIDETEWDKVVGNIGVIAFMQGIPMGNKYYNDYCIVSNNNNKEFVSEDSIYIIDKGDGTKGTYHRAGCKHWSESGIDWVNNVKAYLNIDFRRQTVKGKDGSGNDKYYYYYPQEAQACYNCIVSQNDVLDTKTAVNSNDNLKKIFYRAYAREKYNLYKVNDYLNDT